jgi:hypothetical protein
MKRALYSLGLPLIFLGSMMEVIENKDLSPITEVDKSDKPSLSIVQLNGEGLTLTDGSTYMVHPDDAPTSSLWINMAAPVDIHDSNDGSDYPLTITNTIEGTSVRAALVKSDAQNNSGS